MCRRPVAARHACVPMPACFPTHRACGHPLSDSALVRGTRRASRCLQGCPSSCVMRFVLVLRCIRSGRGLFSLPCGRQSSSPISCRARPPRLGGRGLSSPELAVFACCVFLPQNNESRLTAHLGGGHASGRLTWGQRCRQESAVQPGGSSSLTRDAAPGRARHKRCLVHVRRSFVVCLVCSVCVPRACFARQPIRWRGR